MKKKMMALPAKFARSPGQNWEKCGDWVQCDICDEYICLKCYEKRDISADDDFICSICIGS